MIGNYCEKFNLFVDIAQQSAMGVSKDFLKKIINLFSNNFNGMIQCTYIYDSGWGFNLMWNLIKGFMHESAKKTTKFVKKGQEDLLRERFPVSRWQKRYGGDMDDFGPGEFWPPRKFDANGDILTKKEILDRKLVPLWTCGYAQDKFIWTFENDQSQ